MGFIHLFIIYLLRTVGLPAMTSEEVGKSSPPKSNYKAGKKKKLMKTAIFSTLKIDQKHVVICKVVVLEQLLEFRNNRGDLFLLPQRGL